MCFRVIRLRIISYHVRDHLYSGPPSSFFFIFTLSRFLLWAFFSFYFSFIFSSFCILSLNVCIFYESKFLFRTQSFRSMPLDNKHLHDPQNFTFRHLPSSVEADPWSGFKKKIIRLKRGDYWIIFYISERMMKDGRLSSQT